MSHHKIVSLIFISLLLNACGGSSGDEESNDTSDVTNTSNKQLTQILIDEGNNGEIETTIDYEYNQDDNLIFERSDYKSDGDYDRVVEFAYDDQNNRISEEIWSNKATTLTSKILKTFDSNGNVLTLDISDYFNDISSYQTYTYSGNKIATRTVTGPEFTSVYSYLYTGNVLDIHKDYENDGELDEIETTNYDGKGNIIQKASYDPDGNLFPGGISLYSYDEYGNLLTRGSSISGTFERHSYTYDREGNKLTELVQPAGRAATFITYHYN